MIYPPNIVNNSPAPSSGGVEPSKQYFMSVEAKIYGPYTAELMQQYLLESRLGPHSLMSDHPYAGFRQAQLWPEFIAWSQALNPPAPPIAKAPPSIFIIIADIDSENSTSFINLLFTLGVVKTLSHSAWVISAAISIDDMRDTLSRTLSVTDKLFIHDSFTNRAGWFNIGDQMDEEIRALWMDTAKERRALREQELELK